MLALLGNLVWLICGGFLAGIGYIVGGIALCLTVIGIPFGVQAMKLGVAMFLPFGKEIRTAPDADSPLRIILNIVWLVLWGWAMAINHLFWALLLSITIVGIPFAIQHLKFVPLSLLPFGRTLEQPLYAPG